MDETGRFINDIVAAPGINLLREDDNVTKKNQSIRNKIIMLVFIGLLCLIQFFREILTSEYLMQNVFDIVNKYINGTRLNECSCTEVKRNKE